MSKNNPKCIFTDEEDCPLESIGITCEQCMQNEYGPTIKQALDDYISQGEAFLDIFKLFQSLIDHQGKTVEINIPEDSIKLMSRIVNVLFGDSLVTDDKGIVYKRLIFFFYRILIEEFEEKEYNTIPTELH